MTVKLSYVTCLHDRDINRINNTITAEVALSSQLLSDTLEDVTINCVRRTLIFQGKHRSPLLQHVEELIADICFYALDFSVAIMDEVQIHGLRFIVQDYCTNIFKCKCTVSVIYFKDMVCLTPLDEQRRELWLPETSILMHRLKLNLANFVGKWSVGVSPLLYLIFKDKATLYEGMYIMPLPIERLRYMDGLREEYASQVAGLKDYGYNASPNPDETVLTLLRAEITTEFGGYTYFKTLYPLEMHAMIKARILNIIPTTIISGPWQTYMEAERMPIVYFLLFDRYPSIYNRWISMIRLLPNGALYVPFTHIDDIQDYKRGITDQMMSAAHLCLKVASYIEGFKYRLLLNRIDPHSRSLLVDYRNEIFIVSDITVKPTSDELRGTIEVPAGQSLSVMRGLEPLPGILAPLREVDTFLDAFTITIVKEGDASFFSVNGVSMFKIYDTSEAYIKKLRQAWRRAELLTPWGLILLKHFNILDPKLSIQVSRV